LTDRTKLLVHFRRLSSLFDKAFREGPDGTLEGKSGAEHPFFIHHSNSFYLAGCLAYLEGEDGAYSWNTVGNNFTDFDAFVGDFPAAPNKSYYSRGVSKANMVALAEIRNAVIHNSGDLSMNRNPQSLSIVITAMLPGVTLRGSIINLEAEFLKYVRISCMAVRNYHGEQ
jgi:hypothetical protein